MKTRNRVELKRSWERAFRIIAKVFYQTCGTFSITSPSAIARNSRADQRFEQVKEKGTAKEHNRPHATSQRVILATSIPHRFACWVKISAGNIFFFQFFPVNRLWYFVSKPFFWEKIEKYHQFFVCWISPESGKGYFGYKVLKLFFFISPQKYVVESHLNRLAHWYSFDKSSNIPFCGEIKETSICLSRTV